MLTPRPRVNYADDDSRFVAPGTCGAIWFRRRKTARQGRLPMRAVKLRKQGTVTPVRLYGKLSRNL